MPTTTAMLLTLRLDVIAGPERDAEWLAPRDRPYSLGRSRANDVVLHDKGQTVSRQHAEILSLGSVWRIRDTDSQHGTYLNGNKLAPNELTPLQEGDRLRIGPWTLRVSMGAPSAPYARLLATMDDRDSINAIRRVEGEALAPDAARRLELLMSCAAEMGSAETEAAIAAAAIDCLLSGTGLPRAAYVRLVGSGDQVEVITSRSRGQTDDGETTFSRSLIQAAADGQTVVMHSGDAGQFGQSIVSLDIGAAACAPVLIDGVPDAYLYVDARRGDAGPCQIPEEAASFAQAIARVCGLALANLHRVRLERDDVRRRDELRAARAVQTIIMPPGEGRAGGVEYRLHASPGRFVAGDLFDFFPIDGERTAVFLGDVVGKGIAAGMVMANVQAHLMRMLMHTMDLARAVGEINSLVYRYSQRYGDEVEGAPLFLSLWVGVIDRSAGRVTYVDAGHGHWLLRRADGETSQPSERRGTLVGVLADAVYSAESIACSAGDRLVLFSDGVIEQRSPAGEEHGIDRVTELVRGSPDVAEDVRRIVDAVTKHAGPAAAGADSPFADDVTVASIGLG